MYQIDIQPLSVNRAFQGRRYKTPEYNQYSIVINAFLARLQLPRIPDGQPFYLYLEFGISKLQDASNGIKLFEDVLCSHMGINDRNVMALFVRKVVTKKKDCYIRFNIFEHEYDLHEAIRSERISDLENSGA